jgi:hypothetical protein
MPNPITMITCNGEPVQAGSTTVIPRAQAIHVRVPRLCVNVLWNRPLAVSVTHADGSTHVLPVYDITRLMQLLILAGSLTMVVGMFVLFRRRRHHD